MIIPICLIFFLTFVCCADVPATAGSSADKLSQSELANRKAMAQAMMADLRENMLRRKMAKGEHESFVSTENELSELLNESAKKAKQANGDDQDDDIVVVLFTKGDVKIDLASFRNNAEAMLRARSLNKRAEEDFRRLSAAFHNRENFHFVLVNSKTQLGEAYVEEYEAKDLPTVKLFVNGKWSRDFEGEIKYKELVQLLELHAAPMNVLTKEDDAYDALWNMNTDSIVMGFFQSRDSAEFRLYEAAAERLRGQFLFTALVTKEPLKRINRVPRDRQSVAVFRSFDEPAIAGSALLEGANALTTKQQHHERAQLIANWIEEHASNLVQPVDGMTFNVHVQRGKPLVVMWLDASSNQLQTTLAMLRRVALTYKHRLTFLYADGNKNLLQAKKFGVSGRVWPALTLLDMTAFTRYVHNETEDITAESITKLCDGYLQETLEPSMMKQKPPVDGLTRPGVKQLVYETFGDLVFDNSKNVLVAFCKPDVPSCDVLASILPKVASEFKNDAKFVVAQMDMSQNDAPRHSLRSMIYGYPTIKFFPAADKKAIVFEEPRVTVEGLVDFMKDKAVNFKRATKPLPKLADFQKKLGESILPPVQDKQERIGEQILSLKQRMAARKQQQQQQQQQRSADEPAKQEDTQEDKKPRMHTEL